MDNLLDQIKEPNDIKKIDPSQYGQLAREIRKFLVQKVSRTGGHLASNLGAVELTMALHLCCDFPEDQIVWDVGHQCYTHKILTGRKDGFDSLRQMGGLSGFPKTQESDCDVFDTGHSSTSISVAMGLAKARDLCHRNHKVFAVIGDGAMSGGMAFEALNNAAQMKTNVVIVLNDNQMSISKNVGGMSSYLGEIRTSKNYTGLKADVEEALSRLPVGGSKITSRIRGAKDIVKRLFIPGMLFEDMGLTYIGPIDGHDIGKMITAFHSAAQADKPVVVHVCTRKGKGYAPAQQDPSRFHGVSPFSVKTGQAREQKTGVTYTELFSREMLRLAEADSRVVAVCAAMPSGTGLTAMAERYPDRFFDVGIAEEHAVTFAAGMAAGGLRPVVAVYSTFLQRAYDQIIHDICIGGLPVVLAVDRAGLVGNDGETHQGIFDLAFLQAMPGLTIMAPMNGVEFTAMLEFAMKLQEPVAVRYPRGEAWMGLSDRTEPLEKGRGQWIYRERHIALVGVGDMVQTACEVHDLLQAEQIGSSVINLRFVKPLDEELLEEIAREHDRVYVLEDGVLTGGVGQTIAAWYGGRGVRVVPVAFPNEFIEHGSVSELRRMYGMDAPAIARRVMQDNSRKQGSDGQQDHPIEQAD